jgi:ferredoxin
MYTVPYISTPDPTNPNLRFLEEVSLRTAGVSRLEMCIQCGTCGGSCPSAEDMDHTPRMLFAMIRAGYREEALKSNTPWICVSCYHCVVRCPQGVHIADVMYTLKSMAIPVKRMIPPPLISPRPLSIWSSNTGAAYEFGLPRAITRSTRRSACQAWRRWVLGMLTKQRMDIAAQDRWHQLHKILERAKELER